MKTKIIFLALCLSFIIACKNEDKAATETPAVTENQQEGNVDAEKIKVNPAHGLPGHRCDLPVGAPLTSSTAQQTNISELPSTSVSPIRIDKTPELNPPHGEPYHDCSIPVGAKLQKS